MAATAIEPDANGLTKLIVNLAPQALAALNAAAEQTGHSRTDVVNDALIDYARHEGAAIDVSVTIGRTKAAKR